MELFYNLESVLLSTFTLNFYMYNVGTSASDMHFQAYLLKGLSRWNADHASAAVLPNLSSD